MQVETDTIAIGTEMVALSRRTLVPNTLPLFCMIYATKLHLYVKSILFDTPFIALNSPTGIQ